jgi:hypothetical protein
MKIKLLFTLIILTFIIGCARTLVVTPMEGYRQLKLRPHTKFTHQFDFSNAKELKLIAPNDFKLSLTDSVIQYKDSLLSNYQIFKFTSTASRWHRINVVAYCFVRKHGEFYVFIPEIKIFDKNLHEVEIKRDSSVEVNQHYDKSFFRTAWLFEQPKPNDYYLVVYSDNSNLGHQVSSDTYDMPIGALIIPQTIVIHNSLFGEFRIRVENL